MFSKKLVLTPVEAHQQISDNAISAFRDTVNTLNSADDSIKVDIEAADSRMKEAELEKATLIAIRKKNDDVSKKITEFFGL